MSEYERMTAYRAAKEAEALDWPERYERLEQELSSVKADIRRFEQGYWCRGDPDEMHYCTKCDNSVKPERYPIANYLAHEAIRVESALCRTERDKLRKALVACVAVAKAWHGPYSWHLYYNHSPEMKPIRDLLGPVPASDMPEDLRSDDQPRSPREG